MKISFYILLPFLILLDSCGQAIRNDGSKINSSITADRDSLDEVTTEHNIIIPSGSTIKTRISPPLDFNRPMEDENSYSEYLRNLPLKPHGSEVSLYDGSTKVNYDIYDAVIDMKIGNKDLHQCADAIMRLRAEYLWNQKRYDDIHFNFTNGFRVDYSKWMEGKRMVVHGNKTNWTDQSSPSNTYHDFWEYMELIFMYAGTWSLSKELIPVEIADMKIGDVFIWGGSPGHAILVVDMAKNSKTNERVFLLAQSHMPAQETQILQNPNNSELSPWYSVTEIGTELNTPEWTFKNNELKRFKE